MEDVGAFGDELAAEARELEERRLDEEEEEVFWQDCTADWCARCVRYLHHDPMHVCVFEGRDDKCARCVAHGRGGGSACVAICSSCDGLVKRRC